MRSSAQWLIGALLALDLIGPASASTFDLSTLNVSHVGRFNQCPCYDPVSGTQIFSNASAAQTNYGWTEGTDGSAATLYFMGGTHGNNSGKIYIPTGSGGFPVPTTGTETTIGINNTAYTGDYALGNGWPLYFWFGAPGTFAAQGAPGPVNDLDSLYLSAAPAGLTINGYSDFGTTLVGSYTLPSAIGTAAKVVLGWSGVEYVSFQDPNGCNGYNTSCAGGFYVNDIEVNDMPVTPLPASLWFMFTGLAAIIGFGRKWAIPLA